MIHCIIPRIKKYKYWVISLSDRSKNKMLELSVQMVNGVIIVLVNPCTYVDEHEVDSDRSYSYKEFTEIRKAIREDRRGIEEDEMLYNLFKEKEEEDKGYMNNILVTIVVNLGTFMLYTVK